MNKDTLETRNEKRKKLPRFSRQDSHKKVRIGTRWRKPRGWQNKVRLQFKGYRKKVKTGYCTATEYKGTTKQGLLPIRILRIEDLKQLDLKKHIIILASGVGARNKLKIIEEAKKQGISFSNLNTEKYVEKIKQQKELKAKLKKEKKEKEKTKTTKKKDKKALEEQVKKEEVTEEEISDEEKKKKDKTEKDKLLTKAK